MARMIEKRLAGMTILGTSLAGEETAIAAPEYNVCFDIGRAPREVIPIDNVCLTHGHMDHAAGIAYYFSQRGFIGNAPGRMILPRELLPSVQRLLDVWAEIERHPSNAQLVGIDHLENVEIRRGLAARAFTANHGPAALGYTLIESRHKLRADLLGKSGPELVALKRQGIQIEEHIEVPLLTYSGDTAIGRFLELDFVRTSRAVIIECTFFERDHLSRARAGRHMHVTDLPKVFEAIPDAEIMLVHLTRRTDLREARRIMQRILKPGDLERVSFLMERPPRGDRPAEAQPATRLDEPADVPQRF